MRCGYGLADVALRVIRDVDEQSSQGCWQLLRSYGAKFFQIVICLRKDTGSGALQRCREFGEEIVARRAGIEFALETRDLVLI